MSRLEVIGIEGLPEVTRAADLAGMICDAAELRHRDVVVVTQKVVSKTEGAMAEVDPDDPLSHKPLVERESVRILRRRGVPFTIDTRLAIDLYRADVHKASHPRRNRLPGQIQRTLHIHAAKLSQGVRCIVTHHVNTCGKVNDCVTASQGGTPIGLCAHVGNEHFVRESDDPSDSRNHPVATPPEFPE